LSGNAVPTAPCIVSVARLALQDGTIDAGRLIAMLRVRRYALRRMVICGHDVEIEVGCADQTAADLLEPRLRRLIGPLLLGSVEAVPPQLTAPPSTVGSAGRGRGSGSGT